MDVGTYPLVCAANFVRTGVSEAFCAQDCAFTCPDALVHGRDASLVYDAETKTLSLSVQPKGSILLVR